MSRKKRKVLRAMTRRAIARTFARLDYTTLGEVYCDEGGEAFWKARHLPCETLGVQLAEVLGTRLVRAGRSLYIGAGVAEIPLLLMEAMDFDRAVEAYNLRAREVTVLNQASEGLPLRYHCLDGVKAKGPFDHLWIVSVLNDPEWVPELSSLSYGRANPVTFNSKTFHRERNKVKKLIGRCLQKLARPGLVTTSIEEIPWITDWCERMKVTCVVEQEEYPTAIVEDPVCFMRIG